MTKKVGDISCYGKVVDNNNYHIVADCDDGWEYDDIFLPPENNWTTWEEVVEYYVEYLGDSVTIYEISAV